MSVDISDLAEVELVVDPGQPRYALVGEPVVLDGSGSVGAVVYQWDFGDGRRQPQPQADPVAQVVYEAPGRYQATLTAFDARGKKRTARAHHGHAPRDPRPAQRLAARHRAG